jgi:hypothetical protein
MASGLLYTQAMPRVEYTLSFENYLEMTQGRRNAPRIRTPVIFVATGFCLIVAGYGWLRVMPESWSILGGILLGFGLLATVLAGLLGFLAKPKQSRPDAATLRREYEQFHSEKRAIEFDESGWCVFWYEGADLRPWSCLRALYDQKTLLVLATETTYYWLPKADLQRENQFDSIKSFAQNALDQPQKLFSVPLRPSLFVYVAAWTVHHWRCQYKAMLLGCAVLTLFLYWLYFANDSDQSSHSPWLLALAPLLVLFFEALYYVRNFYFAKWADTAPEVEITADGLAYRAPAVHWIALHRRLTGFHEFPWGFHLYFDEKNFHLIPKRHFSRDQLVQFRQLLSAQP